MAASGRSRTFIADQVCTMMYGDSSDESDTESDTEVRITIDVKIVNE